MILSTYLRIASTKILDKNFQWIFDLIALILFLVIFIIKFISYPLSKFVQEVFLRFYLLCIVYYAKDLSANWIS